MRVIPADTRGQDRREQAADVRTLAVRHFKQTAIAPRSFLPNE
jgi:hypothetical protein